MFLKAISRFRSLRSNEFNIDEEKKSCRSDISKNETSPKNSVIKDSTNEYLGIDKINKSDAIQYIFDSIRPRASIRENFIDLNSKSTQKMSEKLVKSQMHPVSSTQNKINDDDEDVIINEIPTQNEVDLKESSSHSNKSNYSKKELLCVDDDLPGPLVIDLENMVHTEEKYSSDSQSSYHSSPQELFDLCDNELKVCTVNKLQQIQEKKKNIDDYEELEEIVEKKIIDTNQALKTDISLQLKLQDGIDLPVIEMDCASGTTTDKNKMLESAENVREKEKNVKDNIVRLKLPIKGTNKKKFFFVKTSKLIDFVKCKYHPLHTWQHLLTLENINDLSEDDKMKMIKILADFTEVRVIKFKRKHKADN